MDMDPELVEGARNAVQVCMNVGASDRVFILTDDETLPIAQALMEEARKQGAETAFARVEEFGARPMSRFPEELAQRATAFSPTVTFLACSAKANELPLRGGFAGLAAGKLGARHAHMPSIKPRLMKEGMRVDYHMVHDLTMRVYEIVRHAQTAHVTSAEGTDLTAYFDGKLKWVPCHGLYHEQRTGGNLPEGEVYTSPARVEGVFVTRVLGDYFDPKYGILPHPVRFEIADGYCVKVSSEQKELVTEIESYLDSAENGRRVGEFAIGTNTGITALCGSMLQDEKIPGVHIAFGNPLGHETGAEWQSSIHIDIVSPGGNIELDGVPLMREGRFVNR